MVESDNALQDFAQQRFKLFQDQNIEKGRFDVNFQFGTKQLHAHSFVLWPLSKVFEKTFFGQLAEKGPIIIKQHSYEDFKDFLTFLYLGSCKIHAKNVMALVDLAEYYHIKQLKQQCDTFLTTNLPKIDNVLKIYESLQLYTLKNAMAKVMETIASDTEKILKSEDFLNAKKETILDIVKMDNLTSKEEELFQAVLNWASHKNGNDNEKIKKELSDVLPFVRFPIMKLDFLHTFVVSKGFLFSSFEELSGILRDATAFNAENESSAQRYSKYSNKFRGGLRLHFSDGRGNNAYADITDPELIKALKDGINNYKKQSDGFYRHSNLHIEMIPLSHINIEIPQIKNRITEPLTNVNVYLVREGRGRLNVRSSNHTHQIFGVNIFQNCEVIAPVIYEKATFYLDDGNITFKIK